MRRGVLPQWVAEELSYDPLPLGDGAELHLDLEDVLQHIPPIPGLMVDLES